MGFKIKYKIQNWFRGLVEDAVWKVFRSSFDERIKEIVAGQTTEMYLNMDMFYGRIQEISGKFDEITKEWQGAEKRVLESVLSDLKLETQKLESYYEMAREARSIAIKALAKAESLDETKAYLWKASPAPAPDSPLPKSAPIQDEEENLEGNSNLVSMYGTF